MIKQLNYLKLDINKNNLILIYYIYGTYYVVILRYATRTWPYLFTFLSRELCGEDGRLSRSQ